MGNGNSGVAVGMTFVSCGVSAFFASSCLTGSADGFSAIASFPFWDTKADANFSISVLLIVALSVGSLLTTSLVFGDAVTAIWFIGWNVGWRPGVPGFSGLADGAARVWPGVGVVTSAASVSLMMLARSSANDGAFCFDTPAPPAASGARAKSIGEVATGVIMTSWLANF